PHATRDPDSFPTRRSSDLREWVKARDELRQHYAAQVMLRNLHEAQLELMRKIQAGEAIGPEDEERWQRTAELVAYNPYVSAVLRDRKSTRLNSSHVKISYA